MLISDVLMGFGIFGLAGYTIALILNRTSKLELFKSFGVS